jgi:hypothetical protein
MSESEFNLMRCRELLAEQIARYDALLETLIEESAQMPDWAKQKFNERMLILRGLQSAVIAYDRCAQQYVQFHPAGVSVRWYRERLDIARLYVESLGGNWDTVTWGIKSDYP